MEIQNCLHMKQEEKEYWIMINAIYLLACIILMWKVITTDSVYYEKNVMAILTFIVTLAFITKNLEGFLTWMIASYRKLKNNHHVAQIFQMYYRLSYKAPKANYMYYSKGVKQEFLHRGIEILNNLPYEYNVVLKKYPLNFNFKSKRKGENIGEYQIFDGDISTSNINIYSMKDSYTYTLQNMKYIIYHEIAHHIDEVMTENYMERKNEVQFSENDKVFGFLYDNNKLNLWDYFLSSKSEYFAETLYLYMQGELESEELCEFYSDMMKNLMIKLKE